MLHFLPFQCYSSCVKEDQRGKSRGYTGGATMANTSVVLNNAVADDQAATSFRQTERPLDSPIQTRTSASTFEKTEPHSLSPVRQRLQKIQVSERAQHIIMNSWRIGTKKQYNVYLTKWINYSRKNSIDVDNHNIADVLDFLAELFNDGGGYSALNTARSALSTFMFFEGKPVGTHPLVIRFMKGVFESRPSLPRYCVIWDVASVLRFLETWHPLEHLNMKQLTWKLVTLIALSTAQRCQTIHQLDIECMTIREDEVIFSLGKLIKQSVPGKRQPEIVIPRITDNVKLCAMSALLHYLDKTKGYRKSSNLFLSLVKPYQPVTKSTISRWIKDVLSLSGIDTTQFSAHSTRAAAASKAKIKCVPLETIMKTAGWSNCGTFGKFYSKDIVDSHVISFAKTIMK
ncbi:uncharacterized protein LOC106180300 [Lingula anatina]|uniref:Uncharacterized protein LOC106180300 n=1 Tax=Lingula anatina TaxID=7574 RepID=A0A1S3KB46_LINAN|nr:uncharacterized protein LOC106180300 [Lingula anatina]|eukprot:XP_013419712.1 uncharacterized protein LOC106180300 [Lingula anatina]